MGEQSEAPARLGTWNDVEGHPGWFWGVGTTHDGLIEAVVIDRATGHEVVRFVFDPVEESRSVALERSLLNG